MKRFIILALLVIVTASGAFALDMNIGGGALVSGSYYEYSGYDTFGIGAFAFFGVNRFFDINLSFVYEVGWEDNVAAMLGIHFKYPFVISDRIVLFPSVGADFEYTLFSIHDHLDLHELWFRGGLGLDFFLT